MIMIAMVAIIQIGVNGVSLAIFAKMVVVVMMT